jgi:hypothetical protein
MAGYISQFLNCWAIRGKIINKNATDRTDFFILMALKLFMQIPKFYKR